MEMKEYAELFEMTRKKFERISDEDNDLLTYYTAIGGYSIINDIEDEIYIIDRIIVRLILLENDALSYYLVERMPKQKVVKWVYWCLKDSIMFDLYVIRFKIHRFLYLT